MAEHEADDVALEVREVERRVKRCKTEFLFNMSHDLLTPMNAIIGYNQLALRRLEGNTAVRGYLEKSAVSSEQMLSIITDILEMSRIESGRVAIREESFDCRKAGDELAALVSVLAEERGVTLSFDHSGVRHPLVVADRRRIEQVLVNVLTNAIKFTPEGGRIAYAGSDEEIPGDDGRVMHTFRIRDSGIGIRREFLEHLFEPFARERTSTDSGQTGTGLGLAIAKKLVDLMHGSIGVTSEPGRGTECTIRIPMRKA